MQLKQGEPWTVITITKTYLEAKRKADRIKGKVKVKRMADGTYKVKVR